MEHTQQRVVHANVVFGNKSENELISKAKKGDKQAFRSLYDEHIGRVYALCYRLTGEKGMAEDASQEVFIQLWKNLLILMDKANFPRGYTALRQTLPSLICASRKGGCSGCLTWKTAALTRCRLKKTAPMWI